MVPKPDQQRVKSQLTEAIISVLNRNNLLCKFELCVEGLLGITLDSHDIFLLNIKETIRIPNLTGCSPPSKDPSMNPLDLMCLNSLGPSIGEVEDLTVKNTSITSTPGKKNSSYCPLTGVDMGIKGDLGFNFALNYTLDSIVEDLSQGGKQMDAFSMLDNDMGIIMEKDMLPELTPQKCADKVSTMKAAGMDMCFEAQEETLDLSVQDDDVLTTITGTSSKPATPETEEGMPLNLSEPKKKKMNKKKVECNSCHKLYVSEASLSKHKCKATSENSSQPLDLTVGRIEEGKLVIVVPDFQSQSSTTSPETVTTDTIDAAAPGTGENNTQVEELITVNNNNNSDDDDDEESFTCICGKAVSDYGAYIKHTSNCTKAKMTPYKTCETCQKVFFSNSGYLKHQRLHVGAYKLRCRYCQKGFFDSTHLNAHVDARHNKVRTYKCKHCDKGFYWKHHLKRHLERCGGGGVGGGAVVVDDGEGATMMMTDSDLRQQQMSHHSHQSLSSPDVPETTDMDTEEAVSSQLDENTSSLECQWTCNLKAP